LLKVDDGRGRYRRFGKIQTPITEKEFKESMEHGHFVDRKHKGYCVLLYYSAVRKMEAGRTRPEQFQVKEDAVTYDVGIRLKKLRRRWKGKVLTEEELQERAKKIRSLLSTPPLPLPRTLPFMDELVWAIENTEKGKKIWDYSPKTYYNIVRRAFKYSHLFRLSRITWFLLQGWTTAQIRSWTGLTLAALEYYVGIVSTIKMGKGLK
jgi:hypothetical protein